MHDLGLNQNTGQASGRSWHCRQELSGGICQEGPSHWKHDPVPHGKQLDNQDFFRLKPCPDLPCILPAFFCLQCP